MAQLEINYTPQYTGCHRICLVGQEETCCYIDSSLSIVGVSKEVIIDLADYPCIVPPVDEISCEDYSLNGYIQPCCTEEESLLNRVSFTASWPIIPCVQYQLECLLSGAQCLSFTFTDCSGQYTGPQEGIWGGPSVPPAVVCTSDGPPSNTAGNYDIEPIVPGTCCNCKSYTVTVQVPFIIEIYYTDCDGNFTTEPTLLYPDVPLQICAIENTIFTVTENGSFTAEDNGPCIN